MSKNKELLAEKKKEIPGKLIFLYLVYFFLSDFIAWPAGYSLGVYPGAFVKYSLLDVKLVVFITLKYSILVIVLLLNFQRILQYNPDDTTGKSHGKAEKGIRSIEKHMLLWQGFSVLLIIPGLFIGSKDSGIPVRPIAMVLQTIGSTAIVAIFIYVPFLSLFEKWVSKIVPFNADSKIHRKNTERGVLVVVVNSYSQIFIVLAAFICYSQMDISIQEYIIKSIGPQIIVNVILSTLTTYQQFHGNEIRITKITEALGQVAENNYTGKLEGSTSREEFGVMARNMNEFIETTRGLLIGIQKTAESSYSTARDLENHSAATAEAVSRILSSTDDMNESVMQETEAYNQISKSGNEINQGINRLDEDVQSQVAAVEQSSAAIEQMVSNIRSVSTVLEKNAVSVAQLSDASTEGKQRIIESVASADKILKDSAGLLEASTVIQNIAEQTNLLAMNAAIEAAHAGEAGKGFAVVANEIRKLAEDSNKQGKVITDSLQKLQDSIKEISSNTTAVQENFNKIYNLTEQVHNQEEVIKGAMDEQEAGSSQVLDAVRQLTEISSSVTDGSKMMLVSNEHITKDLKTMGEALNNFTTTMNTVSKNAAEINRVVQDTKMATEKNNQEINHLKAAVDKFIV